MRGTPILLIGIGATLVSMACPIPDPPHRYALVYGIGDYPGTNNDLQGPSNDASNMEKLFQHQGYEVIKRTDATKSTILDDIASVGGSGLVVFYYSGHGAVTSEGTAALVPFDYFNNGNGVQPANLLSLEDLIGAFDAAGIKHRVLILDCCHAGGFVSEGPTTDGIPPLYGVLDDGTAQYTWFFDALPSAVSAYLSYGGNGKTVVLAAAGLGEYSWEATIANQTTGVFTYFFLEGVRFGDADGDGYLTTTELYTYTAQRIKDVWNINRWNYYEQNQYADFHPHLSGTAREYLLFKKE